MNEKAIGALCDSYEHPWHKIQRKIEFIQEKKRLSNFVIEEQGIQALQAKRTSKVNEAGAMTQGNINDISQEIESR